MILIATPVTEELKPLLEAAGPGKEFRYVNYRDVTEEDVKDAEIIFGNISPKLLPHAKKLKLLQLFSAGFDNYMDAEVPEGCAICCAVAFGVGIYDGFYGPGTGTFLILLLTAAAHLTLQDANGLTKAINLSTNIAALTVFLANGQVLIPLGIPAGLCNIAGNWIGVSCFKKEGAGIVRPVMLGVLALFMARTVWELVH